MVHISPEKDAFRGTFELVHHKSHHLHARWPRKAIENIGLWGWKNRSSKIL